MNNNSILIMENISKSFTQGGRILNILDKTGLEIKRGEAVALVAPSGAGKSTMLQIAGLLDKANSGKIIIDGIAIDSASDEVRTKIRRNKIGFIYQFHHLLSEFTALENIILPQLIAGIDKKIAKKRAYELLKMVKLQERGEHFPSELSGGEQQRVAIARSLVNRPSLLLADEPTGNLDPVTANNIFNLLLKMVKEIGLGALIATHNMELAKKMDKILTVNGGKIEDYSNPPKQEKIA